MGSRSSLSVMLMLSYCDGYKGNGPDDQFVTLATLARMPENGSASDSFYLTAKYDRNAIAPLSKT